VHRRRRCKKLDARQLDLALVSLPAGDSRYVAVRQEQLVWVASADFVCRLTGSFASRFPGPRTLDHQAARNALESTGIPHQVAYASAQQGRPAGDRPGGHRRRGADAQRSARRVCAFSNPTTACRASRYPAWPSRRRPKAAILLSSKASGQSLRVRSARYRLAALNATQPRP